MYEINKIINKINLHPNVQLLHLDTTGYITKSATVIDWDYYIGVKDFIEDINDDIYGQRVGYYFINHNYQTGGYISKDPEIVIRYLIEENLCTVISE